MTLKKVRKKTAIEMEDYMSKKKSSLSSDFNRLDLAEGRWSWLTVF